MKRTNIFLRDDQRGKLATIATAKNTTPAAEVRQGIDSHIQNNRQYLNRKAGKREGV